MQYRNVVSCLFLFAICIVWTGCNGTLESLETSKIQSTVSSTLLLREATGDTYGKKSVPTETHGEREYLRTSPEDRSFIKFDLRDVDDPVERAIVKIYAHASTENKFRVDVHSVADDSWREETVSWLIAPAVGSRVSSSSISQPDSWVSMDITSLVKDEMQGDGIVSLELHQKNGRTWYRSKESDDSSLHPRLEITIPQRAGAREGEGEGRATRFPNTDDWTSLGVALKQGDKGEWDSFGPDGFGVHSIVQADIPGDECPNVTYFLYYAGASHARLDGGPADRAVGVATSCDGQNFAKSVRNPIMTHQPSIGHPNQEEEGASSPVVVFQDQVFYMFYAAKTATEDPKCVLRKGGCQYLIKNDVRIATSDDGIHFRDVDVALENTEDGGGDEVIPAGALWVEGVWYLWYITDGFGGRHTALATGIRPFPLTPANNAKPILKQSKVSFHPSPVVLDDENVVMISSEGSTFRALRTYQRTANLTDLTRYSRRKAYEAPSPCNGGMLPLIDTSAGVWRAYCARTTESNRIVYVMTAPLN